MREARIKVFFTLKLPRKTYLILVRFFISSWFQFLGWFFWGHEWVYHVAYDVFGKKISWNLVFWSKNYHPCFSSHHSDRELGNIDDVLSKSFFTKTIRVDDILQKHKKA
jgi:hypothetical protein